ncbi:putative sphingomyelin-like synthase [Hamiltosporidium tvaerminnensis]|uniref:Putative sphingomyelin-like synthase n=1 Tax=Hamiltosporidium tvaerminnensis TaxID=1176355 RepID=A0A4Q9LV09_9MICR|nr:putative sphingomyelin-like synthase [Hamiltosporidium tvaerminnensis]
MLKKILKRYNINSKNIFVLLSVVGFTIFTLYMMNLMSNVASFWSPNNKAYEPLPDLFFDLFGYKNVEKIVDTLMYMMLISTAIAILIRKDAILIFFRLATCISFSYLLRMTTVGITNLPDPNLDCFQVVEDTLTEASYRRCGDNIFSGHSIIILMCTFVWTKYDFFNNELYWLIMSVFVWIICITNLVCILFARYHYSVDILLAFYICSSVWLIYDLIWTKYLIKNAYIASLIKQEDRNNQLVNSLTEYEKETKSI